MATHQIRQQKPATLNAADVSKARDGTEQSTAPDAPPSDKSISSAPSSKEIGSSQAQHEATEAAETEPEKEPAPAPTATPADSPLPPPIPGNKTTDPDPTPESAPSVPKLQNGEAETPKPVAAGKAGETLAPSAEAEASIAANGNGVKLDDATKEPASQPDRDSGIGDEESTAMQDDNAKSEGVTKPILRLDHVRDLSTASSMTASSPGTPADDAPLSSVEKEEEGDMPGSKRTKGQKKRQRKKQAQKDNSIVQEPEPFVIAPVDVLDGEGDGVLVDLKSESSGREDPPVIVEKTDAATAETAANGTTDDEWGW
ncbi:hypothetical protein B0F90DRAFT_412492 [Multifurca ochricompacta]|uniref:Uncharacterized protein n=1 Tax=Multifurca ochricompacta TaxID=376703 RepID=A0AAD4M5I4_9AGAM|nr:hypothetical protein B0F90DRAFT_412492 [Multifurca ochricompacta]